MVGAAARSAGPDCHVVRLHARSARLLTVLVFFSGGSAAAWIIVVVWIRVPYLVDPDGWLEGVWEVDYEESNDGRLASGTWLKYDFEATGRLNGSDGACSGPVSCWVVRGYELHLHDYDPLSELIPLSPESNRPKDLPLGRPTTRYFMKFVNGNTVLLKDDQIGGRVTMRRLVGAQHFYADDD